MQNWIWQMSMQRNLKTNTSVPTLKCKIFNVAPTKNAKPFSVTVRQDLAKKILPSLDNLERALQVEGLTEDVKKGLEMVQESLIQALKEEGVEESQPMSLTQIFHMAIQTVPATDDCPAEHIAQVFPKRLQVA